MRKSATSPTVTNHFSPLITYPPSPSGVAVVLAAEKSDPASASEIATASRRSPRAPGIR